MNAIAYLTIFILIILIILTIVYSVYKFKEYKKQFNTQALNSGYQISVEKSDRSSNVQNIINQINPINQNIYNTLQNYTQEQNSFINSVTSNQVNFVNTVNSVFNFQDNNGNPINLNNLPGTNQPNTQLLNNLKINNNLQANNLTTNGNVKICNPSQTKCTEIYNNNANLNIKNTGSNNGFGSVILNSTNGTIIKNSANLNGQLNILTHTGDQSSTFTVDANNNLAINTDQMNIGKFKSYTPKGQFNLETSANKNDDVLLISTTSQQNSKIADNVFKVSNTGEMKLYKDGITRSKITPFTKYKNGSGLKITVRDNTGSSYGKVTIPQNLYVTGLITGNVFPHTVPKQQKTPSNGKIKKDYNETNKVSPSTPQPSALASQPSAPHPSAPQPSALSSKPSALTSQPSAPPPPPISQWIFTNMNGSGTTGPTQITYTDPQFQNSQKFGLTNGIQYWVIPASSQYQIIAAGAASGGSQNVGRGVVVSTSVYLSAGTIISMLVGQQGGQTSTTSSIGGGGGTFITYTANNTPILVAGGGGGYYGPYTLTTTSTIRDANIGTNGKNSGVNNASGGANGFAGACDTVANAGAGLTGTATTQSNTPQTGAKAFINGGIGDQTAGEIGGFGGGGCGGGGYSGGAGTVGYGNGACGGGGSFDSENINGNNAATLYTNTLPKSITTVTNGYNSGNGFIIITDLATVPTTGSQGSSLSGYEGFENPILPNKQRFTNKETFMNSPAGSPSPIKHQLINEFSMQYGGYIGRTDLYLDATNINRAQVNVYNALSYDINSDTYTSAPVTTINMAIDGENIYGAYAYPWNNGFIFSIVELPSGIYNYVVVVKSHNLMDTSTLYNIKVL